MSAETVAADMDALCPELLLPAPADTGRSRGPDAGVAGPSALAVRQSLLLAEGAPTGVQDVEIFVEAMAGNVALSNPGSATGTGGRRHVWAVFPVALHLGAPWAARTRARGRPRHSQSRQEPSGGRPEPADRGLSAGAGHMNSH